MKKLSFGLKLVLFFLAGLVIYNLYFLEANPGLQKPPGFTAGFNSLQFSLLITLLLGLSIVGILRQKFWGYNISIFALGLEVSHFQFWPPLPGWVKEFGSFIPLSVSETWVVFTCSFFISVGAAIYLLSKNKKKVGKSGL